MSLSIKVTLFSDESSSDKKPPVDPAPNIIMLFDLDLAIFLAQG